MTEIKQIQQPKSLEDLVASRTMFGVQSNQSYVMLSESEMDSIEKAYNIPLNYGCEINGAIVIRPAA